VMHDAAFVHGDTGATYADPQTQSGKLVIFFWLSGTQQPLPKATREHVRTSSRDSIARCGKCASDTPVANFMPDDRENTLLVRAFLR
jgi:hypothetical protein